MFCNKYLKKFYHHTALRLQSTIYFAGLENVLCTWMYAVPYILSFWGEVHWFMELIILN